jgi:coatomer protein complex subunit alpha (xenin)
LIKIWDFKQKRRLFTLKGHVDYIRSLFFHPELPWILSASDDQTMRIWNYQRRGCVNIIAGHSHYVMCAQFHPTKNYIVSCSLDSTIRLWDYSVLRKKHGETVSGSIFIGVEIECIRILNGHVKGCDWVCFHPT